MYGWIWRHLPFGLPGKITGSLLLAGAAGALLWFVVFPAAEPLLPFGDVQVTENGEPGGGVNPPGQQPVPGYSPTSFNPSDYIPSYDTSRNNTGPRPSPTGR